MREGRAEESAVDAAVRNVLRLAARVGLPAGTPAAVPPERIPAAIDGPALAREIARRSFVLLRNEPRGERPVLPVDPTGVRRMALIGAAARDARVLGGGSAQVFPGHVVSPLDGLRAALPQGAALTYAVGADPNGELSPAGPGFALRAVCRDAAGEVLGTCTLPGGHVQWMGSDLPDGVTHDALHSVEVTGTFTPRESGAHHFGTRGLGGFRLVVDGAVVFDGTQVAGPESGPFEGMFGAPVERGRVALTAGVPVGVSLTHVVPRDGRGPVRAVVFSLMHAEPRRDGDESIAEAVAAARDAEVAVVVVATTERVESEGFDRADLRLPGRQDELVHAVAAVNPRTVVVVNTGSPVEMPWREEVAAVLVGWFPGQEAGAALADVLLGAAEPGGRLPTTWPARLADAPVAEVVPRDGVLRYDEGVFIGYRAWERAGTAPAYPFGHGLGYTDWAYEDASFAPAEGGPAGDGGPDVLGTLTVRLRNTGDRPGREVVQVYLAAPAGEDPAVGRPARVLAGFLSAELAAGAVTQARIALARRAAQIWDPSEGDWRTLAGTYTAEVARSVADRRLTVPVAVNG